jgi:hypothetical protein
MDGMALVYMWHTTRETYIHLDRDKEWHHKY